MVVAQNVRNSRCDAFNSCLFRLAKILNVLVFVTPDGELLWWWEVEHLVATRVEIHRLEHLPGNGEWIIAGTLAGIVWEEAPPRHGPGVKAVTYQEVVVRETAEGWRVEVTLDI